MYYNLIILIEYTIIFTVIWLYLISYSHIFINVGVENDKDKDKDKDSENIFLNLTVDDLMAIDISKNIIDVAHRYTSSTSSSTSASASISSTCDQSVTRVLFCEEGFCQMINARYEMLDSSYPVLSPEEVFVREQLTFYVRSQTRRLL